MSVKNISFERAVYDTAAVAEEQCTWCGRGIVKERFRANDVLICGNCAVRASEMLPLDTRDSFLRAIGVGVLAAVATCLAYLVLLRFVRETGGFGLGFGAIGVGYAIGRAMRWA